MRARVQSGGGEKIGYHAGVCLALAEAGQDNYQIEAGVSSGAISAYWHAHGYSAQDFAHLISSISNADVFRPWRFGWPEGIFRGSLYDASPLLQTLQRYYSPERMTQAGRRLRLGTVSLETMQYHTATEHDDELPLWCWRSAAHPILLGMGNDLWTDGGVRHVTPLRSAISAGGTEIDVILTFPQVAGPASWERARWERLLKLPARSIRELAILMDEASSDDLLMCQWINVAVRADAPEAQSYQELKLRVFAPKQPLQSTPMQFRSDELQRMLDIGYHETRRLLNMA